MALENSSEFAAEDDVTHQLARLHEVGVTESDAVREPGSESAAWLTEGVRLGTAHGAMDHQLGEGLEVPGQVTIAGVPGEVFVDNQKAAGIAHRHGGAV